MKRLDLSDQPIHAVVDKEEGRYLGLVSTASLDDCRTIFAAYTMGHGRGQGVLKRSDDKGATWSDRLPVPRSWSTLLQVPTLFSIRREDGGQRFSMMTGHFPIRQSISDDNGETWSELQPIGDFGGNVAMSSMLQLPDGSLRAFFHDDGRYLSLKDDVRYELYRIRKDDDECVLFYRDHHISPSAQAEGFSRDRYLNDGREEDASKQLVLDPSTLKKGFEPHLAGLECIYKSTAGDKHRGLRGKIYMCASHDSGMTWETPRMIAQKDDAFFGEPCAFLSPDEKQIFVIMLENTKRQTAYLIQSNDNGVTWSDPRETHSVLNGFRHVARYLPDGRLIIVYGTREKAFFSRDLVAWIGSYDDIASGRQGDRSIRVKENRGGDFGYSGLEVASDGSCVVTSYGTWVEDDEPFVVASRFNAMEVA